MFYDLELTKKDNSLYVCASGVRTSESLLQLAEEIIEICRQQSTDEIFADIRQLKGRISIFDSYQIIFREFPRLKKIRDIKRLAILDDEGNSERLRFIENVARRAGYNLSGFTNYDDAIIWFTAENVPATTE